MNQQSNIFRPIGTPRAELPDAMLPQEGQACNKCLNGMSLAMVYSPCQEFEGVYEPLAGLAAGTIFRELEKPFYGARRLK